MRTAVITLLDKAINFKAREAQPDAEDCDGCMFDGERSSVCARACAEAALAGQPDCEDKGPQNTGYIYVRDKKGDPRQLPLPTTE